MRWMTLLLLSVGVRVMAAELTLEVQWREPESPTIHALQWCGGRLASIDGTGKLQLWELERDDPRWSLDFGGEGRSAFGLPVVVDPARQRVGVATDGGLRFHDLDIGAPAGEVPLERLKEALGTRSVMPWSWAQDGSRIEAYGLPEEGRAWVVSIDLETLACTDMGSVPAPMSGVQEYGLYARGRMRYAGRAIAVDDDQGGERYRDGDPATARSTIDTPFVSGAVVGLDDRLIYCTDNSWNKGVFTVVDLGTGERSARFDSGHAHAVFDLHRPSGRLAVGGTGGDLRIRNLDGAVIAARADATGGRCYAVAFSADGDLVAAGGADGVIRVYRIE